MKAQLLSAMVVATLYAASAQAAIITPVNQDPAGKGLNDTTARAPEGGNPGVSVGEQRRIVYQYAADLWGSVLQSDVETFVGASFQDLACTATGGTLGSAGASWVAASAPSGAQLGMIYHGALANAVNGSRITISSSGTDITSRFNANLGGTNPDGSPCMTGSGWYYGLDGNTPAGQINFLDVVMHEIGHGLGFSGFVGYTSGRLGERTGIPSYYGYSDVYTDNAYDNLTGKRFTDASMTNALRATSIKTRGAPAWDGASAKAQTPLWLDPALVLSVSGTSVVSQFFGTASFGPAATAANFKGPVVVANDGTGPDTADACEALPAGSLAGKVAYVNRGTCAFEIKAANVQAAGAVAAIIGNVASSADPGTAPGMAEDASVNATIPTLSVNLSDANLIKAAAQAGTAMTAALGNVAGQMAGADRSGRPLLYAPATVASGSSFSHFESVLKPDALMEPANSDSTDAARIVDLTLGVFADEGWGLNGGNARIGSCDTGVKLFKAPGMIAGANVQAQDRLCRVGAKGNRGQYLRCMNDTASSLKAIGMVSTVEQAGIRSCAAKLTSL
ncbi:PA domain-containing protein [Stenotrophomonas sp. UBA7606]|uniref:PA domain-containing protein n=1 Tax=Stenotrophomonas sp. UBA7606 TaxID=1947559 RepID=UPI0025E77480|nr:PA domain-containing protein [Stenotrophomonas sp. UBA7606]